MASDEEFLLKWHDHHQSFFILVEELVQLEQLTDVTLACGDGTSNQLLSAHSLMLSVCSPYFRRLLSENRHKEKHHIIHLHGVSPRHMQQLLLYMYRGEISIQQEDLAPLIKTARFLQVKGLSMATSTMPTSSSTTTPKKRSYSTMAGQAAGETSPGSVRRAKQEKSSNSRQKRPSSSLSPEAVVDLQQREDMVDMAEEREKDEVVMDEVPEGALVVAEPEMVDENQTGELEPHHQPSDYAFHSKTHTSPLPLVGNVSLPILPKPLSILKTAETRTFLSKLIWLGNGGKRPQYGNPETKPCWWPQHILPWEEMKKMGGRKSAELTHINYTEILKQCLAAGYEYFGYDPLTYYSNEVCAEEAGSFQLEDNREEELEVGEEFDEEEKQREPVLEIDLDEVENCKAEVRQGKDRGRDILCK